MKLFFLFLSGTLLLLTSCKSSKSPCHRCPYESKIESAPMPSAPVLPASLSTLAKIDA